MKRTTGWIALVLSAGAAMAGEAPNAGPPPAISKLDSKDQIGALRLLLGYMKPADRETRAALVRELRSRFATLPDEAVSMLHETLADQVRTLRAYATQAGTFARRRADALNAARREAMRVIVSDEQYPADRLFHERQQRVDALVTAVTRIYYEPMEEFYRLYPEAEDARRNIVELEETLKSVGRLPPQTAFDEKVFLRDFRAAYHDGFRTDLGRAIRNGNDALRDVMGPEPWKLLTFVNDYRETMGLEPLASDLRLALATEKHSREMRDLKFFSTESPTPGRRTVAERVVAEHFDFSMLGEVRFRGASEPRDAFLGWLHSPDNHRNLLNARFTHAGAGCARNEAGEQTWTLILARPQRADELPVVERTTDPNARHPLSVYHARSTTLKPADAKGHWALAEWCVSQGLPTQAEREAEWVLRAEPDHENARKMLGYRRLGDAWVRPASPLPTQSP